MPRHFLTPLQLQLCYGHALAWEQLARPLIAALVSADHDVVEMTGSEQGLETIKKNALTAWLRMHLIRRPSRRR